MFAAREPTNMEQDKNILDELKTADSKELLEAAIMHLNPTPEQRHWMNYGYKIGNGEGWMHVAYEWLDSYRYDRKIRREVIEDAVRTGSKLFPWL
jgi:hypothetical protein